MSEVYTQTLTSGLVLTVPIEANFGDIIIACIFLGVLAVISLEFIFRLVYR